MNDTTLGDLEAYGAAFPDAPLYLACLGDCDGSADELLADFRKLRRGRPAQDLRLLRGRSLEELLRLRFCHPILQIDRRGAELVPQNELAYRALTEL